MEKIIQSTNSASVQMRADLQPCCNKINPTGPQATRLEPLDESIHIVN